LDQHTAKNLTRVHTTQNSGSAAPWKPSSRLLRRHFKDDNAPPNEWHYERKFRINYIVPIRTQQKPSHGDTKKLPPSECLPKRTVQ
jgi:hypothetical protein